MDQTNPSNPQIADNPNPNPQLVNPNPNPQLVNPNPNPQLVNPNPNPELNPRLHRIADSLSRSLQRHLVDNPVMQDAFAELAFELELARELSMPALRVDILEPTA